MADTPIHLDSASSSTLVLGDGGDVEKQPPETVAGSRPRSLTFDHKVGDPEPKNNIEETLYQMPTNRSKASRKSGITRAATAQDWTGPDDPENPHNWSWKKKIYHMAIPAISGLLVTLGSSIYTPSVPDIMRSFNISREAALLPLSLYTLGLAFGPVIGAPLSEEYGRRVVYLSSLPVSLLFTLGAGVSQSFGSLLVCRFLAGTTGGPCLAVGAGTNVDLFVPLNRATANALLILAPFASAGVGPVIGGYTAQYKDWRWSQWPILMLGSGVWFCSLFQKETYKKIILKSRAKRLNLPPPVYPRPTGWTKVKIFLTVTIFRPVYMLFAEPIVGFYSLYTGINFGILFIFFASFPLVFKSEYGFTPSQTGLTFLGILVGILIAVVIFICMDRLTYRNRLLESRRAGTGDVIAPEHRLYAAMLGSIFLPVGLFWFGWAARKDVHWIVPVLGTVPFACGNLLVFCSAALYLVDTYGPLGGASAMAANGLVRYLFAGSFPLFAVQMYTALGGDWATSLLGFVAVGLMPIPWVLFKYGPIIRQKSHYETTKA